LVIGQLTRGGAEGQLAQVVRYLDRARFDPIVYCLSAQTEPVGTEIAASGVLIRVLTGSPLSRVRQLASGVAADAVELVHSWLYLANAFAGAAHVLQPSRPLITAARNCKVQGWAGNVLAFRLSRAIVVNSQDVATFIERQYRAPRQRIRVVYNGIDVERFHPRDELSREDVGPVVTIGRLVEQKNHRLFLQAAVELSRYVPHARFVIVGDGPLGEALEAQARSLGIHARVSFVGERGDVDAILRAASLFWLTSRWEGMPNVLLEAMASGTPVVATDVGGVRELVRSGIDGFIVAGDDPEAFAHHSRDLLVDAAARRRFATAARQRAEEFSTERMVRQVAELYSNVLGRGQ